MQEVDVIGTSSVASLIEQSGLTKFLIQKTGAGKNQTPVFEFINTKATNGQAKNTFLQWSANVLQGGSNSNVYEILLFNDVVDVGEEVENLQRTKAKTNKMRFSFLLSPERERSLGVLNGYGQEQSSGSTADMIKMAVENALSERDKSDLKKELQELRDEINELREEGEGEEVGTGKNLEYLQTIGAVLLPKLFPKTATPEASINGAPDEERETKINNINRAIKVLWKHDKDLDSDLLKLGALAENNPSQFNFLLNALRTL